MKLFLTAFVLMVFVCAKGQELYVFTEPASNMAANSIGVRVMYKQFKMTHDKKFSRYRIDPEIMFGISKNLMLHVNGYASNMFQNKIRAEGASLYAKYRFFSQDDIHAHLRLAAYGKIAVIDNPAVLTYTTPHVIPDGNGGYISHDLIVTKVNNEIDLDGTNAGVSGGLIATQLKNKLAVSASAGYQYRLNNLRSKREIIVPWHAVNYNLSVGYLLFPKEYSSFKQTNVNLYTEFLGSSSFGAPLHKRTNYFIDIAPAVQFIINSIARIDIGYRTQLAGNTARMANASFLIRAEYNFLNVFSKK